MRSNLEMRLTAALAVRGGKNSRENHLSPASCRRRILSRSRSCRSASRTGVEQRELSLELSLPLLLPPSDLELELALQTILGETHEEEDEILPRKDYESLDYDRCINDPYLEILESMDNKKAQKYEAVKWMLVFAIGVCTGLVGLFVDFFVRLFTQLKFRVVQSSVEECTEKGCLALSLLELLGFNLTFVFLASLLVLIQVRLRSIAASYTTFLSSHTGP